MRVCSSELRNILKHKNIRLNLMYFAKWLENLSNDWLFENWLKTLPHLQTTYVSEMPGHVKKWWQRWAAFAFQTSYTASILSAANFNVVNNSFKKNLQPSMLPTTLSISIKTSVICDVKLCTTHHHEHRVLLRPPVTLHPHRTQRSATPPQALCNVSHTHGDTDLT